MSTKDTALNSTDRIPAISEGDQWKEMIFKRHLAQSLVHSKCSVSVNCLPFSCQSTHSSCLNLKMVANLLISLSLNFLMGLIEGFGEIFWCFILLLNSANLWLSFLFTQGTENGPIKGNVIGDYHLNPVFKGQLYYCCQAGPYTINLTPV